MNRYEWATNRVKYWYDFGYNKILPNHFIEYKPPKVTLNRRLKSCAGRAWYGKNQVELATHFLFNESQESYDATIAHEVAHILSYQMYGNIGMGHGNEWKNVMWLLGQNATRCHQYESTVKRNKDFRVYCGCDEKFVSRTIYSRMEMRNYRCLNCNQIMRFKQETPLQMIGSILDA
jgi:SprT protein